jgi:hypothetical protein
MTRDELRVASAAPDAPLETEWHNDDLEVFISEDGHLAISGPSATIGVTPAEARWLIGALRKALDAIRRTEDV